MNGAAVGEPGARGVFVVSCGGRMFDENKLVCSALLDIPYASCAFCLVTRRI